MQFIKFVREIQNVCFPLLFNSYAKIIYLQLFPDYQQTMYGVSLTDPLIPLFVVLL